MNYYKQTIESLGLSGAIEFPEDRKPDPTEALRPKPTKPTIKRSQLTDLKFMRSQNDVLEKIKTGQLAIVDDRIAET